MQIKIRINTSFKFWRKNKSIFLDASSNANLNLITEPLNNSLHIKCYRISKHSNTSIDLRAFIYLKTVELSLYQTLGKIEPKSLKSIIPLPLEIQSQFHLNSNTFTIEFHWVWWKVCLFVKTNKNTVEKTQ